MEGVALCTMIADLSEHKFILQNPYGVLAMVSSFINGKEHGLDKVRMLPILAFKLRNSRYQDKQWSPSANAVYPQMECFMAYDTCLSSWDRFNFLGSFFANFVSIENVRYRIS